MARLTIALHPSPGPLFFLGSPEETLDQAAALGFDGVDVAVGGVDELRQVRPAELAAARGLRVASLLTGGLRTEHGLSLSDPELAEEARARLLPITEAAAEMGAALVIGWLLGSVPTEAERARRTETMVASLAIVAEHAAQSGVTVLLEPINRYESNLASTAEKAMTLIDRAGGGIELILDSFHVNIEEADPIATARRFAARTGLIQLADSNRRVPGYGHFPLRAWVEAIRGAGYQGEFALEALYGDDPVADARAAIEFMRALGL